MWISPLRTLSRLWPTPGDAAYRLRGWPDLEDGCRNARVYRALSRMNFGPVNASWFAQRTGLSERASHDLLEHWVADGYADRIDLGRFADSEPPDEEPSASWWQRLVRTPDRHH